GIVATLTGEKLGVSSLVTLSCHGLVTRCTAKSPETVALVTYNNNRTWATLLPARGGSGPNSRKAVWPDVPPVTASDAALPVVAVMVPVGVEYVSWATGMISACAVSPHKMAPTASQVFMEDFISVFMVKTVPTCTV